MIAGAEVQPEPLERPRVVVIAEDEILIRWALAEELRAFGWNIIEVATADDAIEILHTRIEVDMVITDVNMPGPMDGKQLARELRRRHPDLPILLMSGAASDGDVGDGAEFPFIAKPFRKAALLRRVRAMVE